MSRGAIRGSRANRYGAGYFRDPDGNKLDAFFMG
jgi:hypothetical protein